MTPSPTTKSTIPTRYALSDSLIQIPKHVDNPNQVRPLRPPRQPRRRQCQPGTPSLTRSSRFPSMSTIQTRYARCDPLANHDVDNPNQVPPLRLSHRQPQAGMPTPAATPSTTTTSTIQTRYALSDSLIDNHDVDNPNQVRPLRLSHRQPQAGRYAYIDSLIGNSKPGRPVVTPSPKRTSTITT